jgi:hypothetical protein
MTALLEEAPQVKELPPAPELLHEELERRAYFRYLNRGCTDGLALEDWLGAESELREETEGASPRIQEGMWQTQLASTSPSS